jgi:hypothetical protein
MFNYRSAENSGRVLRRIWYVADAFELRSRWIAQATAVPENRRECNETVILACDTGTRCK